MTGVADAESFAAASRVLRDQFSLAQLAEPVWPDGLIVSVEQAADWMLSSGHNAPPYQLQEYVEQFVDDPTTDRLIVAHNGHGANSWALCHYVVHQRIGVFIHSAWGGAATSSDGEALDRERFAARQAGAARLWQALDVSPLPDEDALLVVSGDFVADRWARWTIGEEPEPVESADVFADAAAACRSLRG
jgi:hypothetical protein